MIYRKAIIPAITSKSEGTSPSPIHVVVAPDHHITSHHDDDDLPIIWTAHTVAHTQISNMPPLIHRDDDISDDDSSCSSNFNCDSESEGDEYDSDHNMHPTTYENSVIRIALTNAYDSEDDIPPL